MSDYIAGEIPILEFDPDRAALIEPHRIVKRMDVPRGCVITFFRDVVEKKERAGKLARIYTIRSETMDIPVCEMDTGHGKTGLATCMVGSAGAAGVLEELIALGFEKFIVCGGAGVLRKDIAVGHLIVPEAAVRDEGASYHYLEPSREAACGPRAVKAIEDCLKRENIPYIKGKTWTTDAFYRETRRKLELRVSEGCVTVEMEAAAFFAVAQFRGVTLGQILYGGDDLSGEQWDDRNWKTREDIRENLVDLSARICLEL